MRRRGFLASITAALAVAPATILKQAGTVETSISGTGIAAPLGGLVGSGFAKSNFASTPPNWAMQSLARLKLLKTIAPWWFEAKRRQDTRHVNILDIDLATHRGISPAAKIAIQRERNYLRRLDEEERHLNIRAQKKPDQQQVSPLSVAVAEAVDENTVTQGGVDAQSSSPDLFPELPKFIDRRKPAHEIARVLP